MQRQRGLTLLELLVVLAIIGLTITGVSLSLRDSQQTQLEREAQRLVAVLEAARAQSRTSGTALVWQPTPEGFFIHKHLAPHEVRTEAWLAPNTQAVVHTSASANGVVLGPEPILSPAHITLRVAAPNSAQAHTLRIGTDGLQPFQVLP